MREKLNMRITSFLLTLCMLATFVPAMPMQTAKAAEGDVVLNFADSSLQNTRIDNVSSYGTWNWKYNADLTSYTQSIYDQNGIAIQDGGSFMYRSAFGGYYINFNMNYGNMVLNFNVDTAGWYILDSEKSDICGIGATESGKTNVYVGTADGYASFAALVDSKSNESLVKSNITAQPVYLEQGENVIVFKGIENSANPNPEYLNNHTIVRNLTFSPAQAPATYAQTIDVTPEKIGSQIATYAKLLWHGWEVFESETSDIMYTFLNDPDSSGNADGYKLQYASSMGTARGFMRAQFRYGENNTTLTYKFFNEVEGKYDISLITYDLQGEGFVGSIAVNGKVMGDIDCANSGGSGWVEQTKEFSAPVYLERGVNTITFTDATSANNHLSLSAIKFAPSTKPMVVEMNFGRVDLNAATIADDGYKLNDNSDIKAADNVNTANLNLKIPTGKALVVDFEVPADGYYELLINSGECSDYGFNGKIYVDNNEMGNIHNDSNKNNAESTDGEYVYRNKGFGKVYLEKGARTLKIVGLEPDVINAYNRAEGKTDRAGSVQFCVTQITLTEVAGEVVKGIDISCGETALSVDDSTTVTAKVKMSDGSDSSAAAQINYVSDPDGVISVVGNTVTALKPGRAVIEAEYTDGRNVVYQEQVEIAVTEDDIFGNVYAYIEESSENPGNYDVNFLGGIKKLDGYKEVGFYVYVGSDGYDIDVETATAKKTTSSVYKKISANGTDYTAEGKFNVGADGYIFCINDIEIAAGATVIVKPFVVTADGDEIFYGQQYKMTVSQ